MLLSFFKSKPSLVLNIKTPCSEKWEDMQDAGRNKFCDSCSKQVIDFSLMSDEALLSYFEKHNGNTCGKLTVDQMNRVLQVPKKESLTVLKKWMAAFVLFFNLISGKAQTQELKTNAFAIDYNGDTLHKHQDALVIQDTSNTKLEIRKIKGYTYYQNTSSPISEIHVQLEGSTSVGHSDSFGYFELNVPDSCKNDTLFLLFMADDQILLRFEVPKDSVDTIQNVYLMSLYTGVTVYSLTSTTVSGFISTTGHGCDIGRCQPKFKLRNLFDFSVNLKITQENIHPNLKGEMNQPRVIE